jgi:tetratricopeptide (TPR) repeat protein
MTLRKANPYGLYGGEAMLELGRIALECHLQPQAARGCFLLLDTWTREFKNKAPLEIEKLAALPEAAVKVTTPPKEEKYVDFWGNVKKSEIKPGMLVNPKTCPWYLDDLKEQCAMYMGFLYFFEGDKENALAWYKKILDCDEATKRLNAQGEYNDYSRLTWGAEHGYLFAYPQELASFEGARQRLGALLVDFYYCTEQNEKGIALCKRLLDGQCGRLNGPGRDYIMFAMGACLERSGRRQEALEAYGSVLASRDGTYTECRAALAAGKLAIIDPNESVRKKGVMLLNDLAKSGSKTPPACEAMLVLGKYMLDTGRREEGFGILGAVPGDAGPYKDMANILIRMYRGEALDKIMADKEAQQ